MSTKSNIGVIGLAVMGANLARNLASKGYRVNVYNRTFNRTDEVVKIWNETKEKLSVEGSEGDLVSCESIEQLVASLELPRKIILMVKSGQPVDDFIQTLHPYLEKGDVILDFGNSNWKDTQRRQNEMSKFGVEFVGCGVSGGEEGALYGPSIMPGGEVVSVNHVLPFLEKIAAKDFVGTPCVTNVGLSAAGHFVKMVHNGIEYGIMQGIAEIYDNLRHKNYSNTEISEFFDKINHGKIEPYYNDTPPIKLESFLIDITVKILQRKDDLSESFLIDKIKDEAKAKGTGSWTVEAGLELGSYIPTLAAAVFARTGSARNQGFKVITKQDETEEYGDREVLEMIFALCLETIYIACFLQGIDLIDKANKEYNWKIDLKEVLRIWQGGCIIRTKLLDEMWDIWESKVDLTRRIYVLSFITGFNRMLPFPVMHSSLDYFQTLVSEKLPTNLIQAQRDFFGAHTYTRNDKDGVFSGGWEE